MTPNFALSALYALDNLEVMRGMDSESVPLIYADPPFNSRRIYQGISGSKAQAHRFRDTWSWDDARQEWLDQLENDHPALHRAILVAKDHSPGMGGYGAFMAVRLIEMRRILTPAGLAVPALRPQRQRLPADAAGRRVRRKAVSERNRVVLHRARQRPRPLSPQARHDTVLRQVGKRQIQRKRSSHPVQGTRLRGQRRRRYFPHRARRE